MVILAREFIRTVICPQDPQNNSKAKASGENLLILYFQSIQRHTPLPQISTRNHFGSSPKRSNVQHNLFCNSQSCSPNITNSPTPNSAAPYMATSVTHPPRDTVTQPPCDNLATSVTHPPRDNLTASVTHRPQWICHLCTTSTSRHA